MCVVVFVIFVIVCVLLLWGFWGFFVGFFLGGCAKVGDGVEDVSLFGGYAFVIRL